MFNHVYRSLFITPAIVGIISFSLIGIKIPEKYILYSFISSGPFFIKLGQWLSQYPIPDHLSNVLKKLQDSVPYHSKKYTIKILEEQLPEKYYYILNIIDKPIASGSIAQVYIFPQKNICVKICHPDIKNKLLRDSRYFSFWFSFLSFFGNLFGFNIFNTIDLKLLNKTLIKQSNMNLEGANLDIFNNNFKDNKIINFPKKIYTTNDILIMSYEKGYTINKFIEKYPDYEYYARITSVGAYFKMLLVDGFIHNDCHDGNILYNFDPINEEIFVTFIDAGAASTVENSIKNCFLNFHRGFKENNVNLLITAFKSIILSNNEKNIKDFINSFLEHDYQTNLKMLKSIQYLMLKYKLKIDFLKLQILSGYIMILKNINIETVFMNIFQDNMFPKLKNKINFY